MLLVEGQLKACRHAGIQAGGQHSSHASHVLQQPSSHSHALCRCSLTLNITYIVWHLLPLDNHRAQTIHSWFQLGYIGRHTCHLLQFCVSQHTSCRDHLIQIFVGSLRNEAAGEHCTPALLALLAQQLAQCAATQGSSASRLLSAQRHDSVQIIY